MRGSELRTRLWLLGLLAALAAGTIAPRVVVAAEYSAGYGGAVTISALVRLTGDDYLLVYDKKTPRDDGPRMGVMTLGKDSVSTAPLPLGGAEGVAAPSDLEAACAIPGRDGECLLAESGYYRGDFGRIFHIRVTQEDDQWQASLLASCTPFPMQGEEYTTPSGVQVEGMACVLKADGELMLVLARRGTATMPAGLVWGRLQELGTPELHFRQAGEATLPRSRRPLHGRGAADLYLRPAGLDAWRVWTVHTLDLGDHGPFRSTIYDAGRLVDNAMTGLAFERERLLTLWVLEGLKVEALADPPDRAPGSVLTIGTDDEEYGGILRPLMQPAAD